MFHPPKNNSSSSPLRLLFLLYSQFWRISAWTIWWVNPRIWKLSCPRHFPVHTSPLWRSCCPSRCPHCSAFRVALSTPCVDCNHSYSLPLRQSMESLIYSYMCFCWKKKNHSFVPTLKQKVLVVAIKDFSLPASPAVSLKYNLLQPYSAISHYQGVLDICPCPPLCPATPHTLKLS